MSEPAADSSGRTPRDQPNRQAEAESVAQRRARGLTFQQIADDLGMSRPTAQRRWAEYVRSHKLVDVEMLRAEQVAELALSRMAALKLLTLAADDGDADKVTKGLDALLRAQARQATLTGLDDAAPLAVLLRDLTDEQLDAALERWTP